MNSNKRGGKDKIYLILSILFIVLINVFDIFLVKRSTLSHLTYLLGWNIILINGFFNKRTNLVIRILISIIALIFVSLGMYCFQ